ncbi:hypothetical protein K0B96_14185 [Horticoccus luteus]|uniref:Glycosyl hydrolase family 43 n=1 Tax=Horticoccus luteus TaxID=2862869 RepID=A0A8F9TSI8_9BACT|nr:hypothetical protein [Horticoccus luteus]QYM78434.1 hypothetical protein K0B96_14185 [Horticoccus luteus]
MPTTFPDGRPSAQLRLAARDQGVIFRHGEGPAQCDMLGAREANVFLEDGVYHLFYDGAGPRGWLVCLATSRDLVHWERHGPLLDFGSPGSPDSATATSPWVIHDGTQWRMFYVASPNASPAPDYIPSFPYLTLTATAPRLAGPWTKHYDVRPFVPQPGTWHSLTASPGFVLREGGEYLQYFSSTTDSPAGIYQRTLGLARTRDLAGSWTIDPEPLFPVNEQVENTSVYFEPTNGLWFLFTNHVASERRADGTIGEWCDAIWVYWSRDPRRWDQHQKAIVLDRHNCTWSQRSIGMPSVLPIDGRLALFYDGNHGEISTNMQRDVGLAWLDLPLRPPA